MKNQGRMLIAAVGAATSVAAVASARQYTFTGSGSPAQWCNANNWSPAAVPPDGAEIIVPSGKHADMSQCSNQLRVLGPITAGGTIRFYTPVRFAADANLTNPVFEFSSDPVLNAGTISVSGTASVWQGGIFSSGILRNEGTLLVERSFISGRAAPREMAGGSLLSNNGTINLRQGFTVNDSAMVINAGTINCEADSSIGRDRGSGLLANYGTIEIPATRSFSLACGLQNHQTIHCLGTMSIAAEGFLRGDVRLEQGGLVRVQVGTTPVFPVGPVQVSGVGSLQLLNGFLELVDVSVSARDENGARGLWVTSVNPVTVRESGVYVAENGLMTWSRGTLAGTPEVQTPHIRVAAGGLLNAIGAPGFTGGGDARDLYLLVEGTMRQYSRVRLLEESDLEIALGAVYSLVNTQVDGDGSGVLTIRGVMGVNGPTPGNPASITNTYVAMRDFAYLYVYSGDFNTGVNGSPVVFDMNGDSRSVVTSGARWRASGNTVASSGTPRIEGQGTFELLSGATLTVGSATLTMDMGVDITQPGQFTQFGEVRADLVTGTDAKFKNEGRWTWRAGAIRFPQGVEPPVENLDSFTADCGSCQLRSDFINHGSANILDTLVMAEAGVDFINRGFCSLTGFINDATSNLEGRFINYGILSRVGAASQSFISTTLDNQGRVEATQGILNINGPIVQYSGGELRGGRWSVLPGAVMTFGGRSISYVARGVEVDIDGAWNEFRPTLNRGTLGGRGLIRSPGMINEGTIKPGRSPGRLSIEGNLTQTAPDGEIQIELAGTTPDTQHDVLAVTGTVSLGGTLRVFLLDGFIPAPQDVFTVITGASVSGDFASVIAPAGLEVIVERTATSVRLRVTCPADFNHDRAVDFFDYLDFVVEFAGATPLADFNEDAVVDFFDYLDFVSAFAAGC